MKIPQYEWHACSEREFGWPAGHERHLVRHGQLATACGASATTPDIWRRNKRKPKCKQCTTVALRLGLE